MLNQIKQTVMTAQEFFEQNNGKYFKYSDDVVRVVGYGGYYPAILVTKKEGWDLRSPQSTLISYINKSLISKTDEFLFLNEEDLTPIEQSELDLCKLLKGCEGMVFYSTMVGYCRLIEVTEYITISYEIDECIVLESDGKYSIDGECTLFPSKDNRDWSTFKRGPFMCSGGTAWILKKNRPETYTYVVPVSEFNFDDFDSNKSKSIV